MRRSALLSVAAAAALFLASCTGGGGEVRPPASPSPEYWHGGTLRVSSYPILAPDLDPKNYAPGAVAFELLRCCLLRTLLSYNGRSIAEGGTVLRPDLAARMPEVSDDGLAWTFHLEEGLHYAPPFENVEIVAGDIVRGLERPSAPWDRVSYGYQQLYYSIISGFDAFSAGESEHIAGLETPDDHTLVVHLTEPSGDLGNRFALAATAPLPAGAADGHVADYGRFLVASGPYMIEGSQDLDFSPPPKEQKPVSGFVPPQVDESWNVVEPGSLTLVRNPSWEAATDLLRPAYADRIEIEFPVYGGLDDDRGFRDLASRLEAGELDVEQVATQPERLATYPQDRVRLDEWNVAVYMPMNLAVPPFDDPHVRKAVVLVIDRAAVAWELGECCSPAEPATHVAPDVVEGGLLEGWAPEWLSGPGGDVEAARAEMRLSTYDTDADGSCDDPACEHVSALVYKPEAGGYGWSWGPMRDALARIGIRTDATFVGYPEIHDRMGNATAHWALIVGFPTSWIADFPNGSTFFVPILSSHAISAHANGNGSLLGATPEQLEDWGYPVTEVPSVDDRIDRCMTLTGSDQTECWADLDRYLMTEIVPWVPLVTFRLPTVLSERVDGYSFDPAINSPAFDRISLVPGSE